METERLHRILREAILASDHNERYRLLDSVGRVGLRADRDLPILVELLGPEYAWFPRSLAAWEIGKLGREAAPAVPALAELALDRDVMIDPRWAALWALDRLGPVSAPAIPAMCDILGSDREADMRSAAAKALGPTGEPEASTRALVAALGDDDSLVREESAVALAQLDGEASEEATFKLFELATQDGVRPVRDAATEALSRTGNVELAARAVAEAADLPPPVELPELFERLNSDNPRTRAETTWPIGKFGADAAIGAPAVLRQLRTDPDPDARWGAAWCIGRMGEAAARSAQGVAEAVREDPDPDVRAEAAWALGQLGSDQGPLVDALIGALADVGASLLREEAAIALGSIGGSAERAAPALRLRLEDAHPVVRERAANALRALEKG